MVAQMDGLLRALGVGFSRGVFDPTEDGVRGLVAEGWRLPEGLTGALPKRRAEFLAGRACAARALAAVGGPGVQLGRDAEGRAAWPEGWMGAITHSHGVAGAVAGPAAGRRGLGLDVEAWMAPERAERLKGRILCPGEDAQRPPELSFADFLTVCFSAKESLYKALYGEVRRYFGFSAARLVSVEEGRFELVLTAALTDGLPAGACFSGVFKREQGRVWTFIDVPRLG